MSEKFSLKWNDYQLNWNKSLNELRKDTDFADITLISDDKVKFSAHRILLSTCSNFFKFILKDNVQANPLMYPLLNVLEDWKLRASLLALKTAIKL